jgi:hypothetical protein
MHTNFAVAMMAGTAEQFRVGAVDGFFQGTIHRLSCVARARRGLARSTTSCAGVIRGRSPETRAKAEPFAAANGRHPVTDRAAFGLTGWVRAPRGANFLHSQLCFSPVVNGKTIAGFTQVFKSADVV